MREHSESQFNLPTIEDVHRWGRNLERLKAEEAGMKKRHQAEEKALRTRVDKLGNLIAAATAFIEVGVEMEFEHPSIMRAKAPEVTPAASVEHAVTRHRHPSGKTWTETILKIVEKADRGMTYHELKEEISKTHLGDKLQQTEKAFYGGVWKLVNKGKIVRYRGRAFSPGAYDAFKDDVGNGLVDDIPETGPSGRRSPNEIAVERFLASRGNGATTKEIVDGLVNDPPSDLAVTKNRTTIYNLLSRYKKNNRLIKRDGRYFLPSSSNETPDSNDPGEMKMKGAVSDTKKAAGDQRMSPAV